MALPNPYLAFAGLHNNEPLGRTTELNQLSRVEANLGSLHLLLKGPRGVGKTTILTALVRRIEWTLAATAPKPLVFRVSLTSLDTASQVVRRIQIAQDSRMEGLEAEAKVSFGQMFDAVRSKIEKNFKRAGRVAGQDVTENAGNALAALLGAGNAENAAYLNVDQYVDAFCSKTRHILAECNQAIADHNRNSKRQGAEIRPIAGVVFIFDEADTVDPQKFSLATFVKLAHEQFATDASCLVSFVVAGLDDVDKKLLESHPSALRLLELVELEPFALEEGNGRIIAKDFVDEFLKVTAGGAEWSAEERALLTRLGEGIPFWVQRIAYYAFMDAQKTPANNATTVQILVPHILDGYEKALREVGRAACQSAMSLNRSSDARRLIACLAFSGQRELEKSELIRIAGLADDAAADPALREVIDTEAVRSRRTSAGTMISFVTDGYQRWLSSELGALDIVDSMPSLTQALHDLEQPVKFYGEAVPAFAGVESLFAGVMQRLGLPARSNKVEFRSYSHENLFTTLGVSPIVEGLGGGSELRPEQDTNQEYRSLAELWETSDVLAIPSYLLSEAYRLGVHDIDELTHGLPEAVSWKRYLEAATVGFFSTCVFNNSWVALPFTLVPKVYYTPTFDGDAAGLLLESRVGSLSLAYLWTEYARRRACHRTDSDSSALFVFDDKRMDIALNEWCRTGTALQEALGDFSKIVGESKTHGDMLPGQPSLTWDFPKSWERANETTPNPILEGMASKKLSYYGWADWFVQIAEPDRSALTVSAFAPVLSESGRRSSIACDGAQPDASTKVRRLGVPKPQCDFAKAVWADSWVLVFPKSRLMRPRATQKDTLAAFRVFMALMAPDWQEEFQNKTGVSPFRSVLKSTRSWRQFPWLKQIDLDSIQLMSKGDPLDHYRMQAKTALLSQFLKPKNGNTTDTVAEQWIKRWNREWRKERAPAAKVSRGKTSAKPSEDNGGDGQPSPAGE